MLSRLRAWHRRKAEHEVLIVRQDAARKSGRLRQHGLAPGVGVDPGLSLVPGGPPGHSSALPIFGAKP